MQVYLAAQYARKQEMREFAARLERNGIAVRASWLAEPDGIEFNTATPAMLRGFALADVADIQAADAVVYFTEPPPSPPRGGRHVEFGIALGRGKPVFAVGPQENIFCLLPEVRCFSSKEDLLRWLLTH